MIRDDLSHNLVHLVKGREAEGAVATFDKILEDRALVGGGGNIRGDWRCVCFTETPLAHLAHALNVDGIRYFPAGVMVTKEWLFSKGGRPVIYQPEADYALLPEELRYRHVRYELNHARAERAVDWTWEREWRIRTDHLAFAPDEVTLVCPTRKWADRLKRAHTVRVRGAVMRRSAAGPGAQLAVKEFPWHCVVLEDLGVPMLADVTLGRR